MRKVVSQYNGSAWIVAADKRFVYDGWNLVEEQTLSPASSRFYVWGLDLSQSLQGAGGIGGLLATVSGSTTDHFLYDGNGNVGQLINATSGSLDAQYEYDPYGNLILSTGTLSASNPFRFSTKYLDTETGLYYYGYRYYDPKDGRWLSRDPIEEDGGLNLYAFVLNNPTTQWDALGQQTTTTERPLMYSDFERAIKTNPSTSKSLLSKAYRGISQRLGLVIYALLRIQELTTRENCLKLIVDNFKKNYSLENEEIQALSTLILAGSNGRDDIIRQFQNDRKLPVYWVTESLWPNIYEHTNAFIKRNLGGRIQVLHYNGPLSDATKKNRIVTETLKASTPGKSAINNEFDEYPMASTQEGGNISAVGKTISVKWLPSTENRSAGGTLLTTVYRRHNMQEGDPFLTITVPRSGIK